MRKSTLFLFILFPFYSNAQKIFLDKYQQIGGITVYQSVDDSNSYYYLPQSVQIAKGDNGKPEMLFMKFVKNISSNASDADRKEGEGGGIFHALVSFEEDPNLVVRAEKILQKENPKAKIYGPITYKSGKVALISAIAGSGEKKILGLGNAPTMEGNKTAVAFRLTGDDAILLWETFKTPNPDVSFAFEMEMEGFLSPRKGYIKGDFDRIYSSNELGVAGGFPASGVFIGAEIGAAFDKLRNKGGIEVYQEGNDKQFDEFLKIAYKQLAEIIFQRMDQSFSQYTSQVGQSSPLDKLAKYQNLLGNDQKEEKKQPQPSAGQKDKGKEEEESDANKGTKEKGKNNAPEGNKNIPGGNYHDVFSSLGVDDIGSGPSAGGYFIGTTPPASVVEAGSMPAIMATYKFRKSKQSGKFEINFNKVSAAQQYNNFTENIGFVDCPDCFREVNLSVAHKAFDQREILYILDGAIASEFKEYINFVDVLFKKKHQSGQSEHDNGRIVAQLFSDSNNLFKVTYGYDEDTNLEEWLDYEYKTTWSFHGGFTIEEDWQSSDIGTIALDSPLERKIVKVESRESKIKEQQIDAVVIKVFYDYGGGEKMKELQLYEEWSGTIQFLLPEDKNDYEYEITWMLGDGSVITSGRKSSTYGLLFVDNLPK